MSAIRNNAVPVLIGFLIIFFLFLPAAADQNDTYSPAKAPADPAGAHLPDTSSAHVYHVLGERDFSTGYGRIRKAWCISSGAETFEARAHTVMEAAIALQQQYNADYVQVEMTPVDKIGCGRYYTAMAEYAPDGGGLTGSGASGRWMVKASDVVLGPEERLVVLAWEEARPKFEKGGEVDIEQIASYLGGQLNLTARQVKDFWLKSVEMNMTLRSYPVEQSHSLPSTGE